MTDCSKLRWAAIGALCLAAPLLARPAAAQETQLHIFGATGDGVNPQAQLVKVGQSFYGTTAAGGANGLGTIYTIAPNGAEAVLYSFQGGTDGATPLARLVNLGGTLYGTTSAGGTAGLGTVFSVTLTGAETVLHSFQGGADGATPTSELVAIKTTLYGTTQAGGTGSAVGCKTGGCGTVYSITPAGVETPMYSFRGGNDGVSPNGLTVLQGKLFGTTQAGGGVGCNSGGCGTVFRLKLSGRENVLYRFAGGADASAPHSTMIAVSGTFYGVSLGGGAANVGTVFAVTRTGVEHVVYPFQGGTDGAMPLGKLSRVNGVFYGTTRTGGGSTNCTSGCGTVFSVTSSGTESVLYAFKGGVDGAAPYAGLLDNNGTFYGVTDLGGQAFGPGSGTAFSLPVP